MKCPVCQVDLLITDKQGVEIDYCPKCRGIWLDRGELDKIIERSEQQIFQFSKFDEKMSTRNESLNYYSDKNYKRHKKKSILSEIFDF